MSKAGSTRKTSRLRLGTWVLALACASGIVTLLAWAHGPGAGGPTSGRLEKVWGSHGRTPGLLHLPRAMASDPAGQLYIVDKTARIQVFDREGRFLRGWQTPESAQGKPTGLSFDRSGRLMVADTHYFRILFYEPDGTLLPERTLGGQFGQQPGQFGLVTDVVQDSAGCYYVAEYGEYDRIQKFAPNGSFLLQWGGHGSRPGEFMRPQNLAVDEQDRIWVADACNDRIQVFAATGAEAQLVDIWGQRGSQPGQLRYPYDLLLDDQDHVYVCEFGNHRVQKFTLRRANPWAPGGRVVAVRASYSIRGPWCRTMRDESMSWTPTIIECNGYGFRNGQRGQARQESFSAIVRQGEKGSGVFFGHRLEPRERFTTEKDSRPLCPFQHHATLFRA